MKKSFILILCILSFANMAGQTNTLYSVPGDNFLTIGDYSSTNGTKGILFTGYRDVVPNYFGASIEAVNSWICCGGYPGSGYAGIKHIGLNFNIHNPNNLGAANDKITAMSITSQGLIGIGTTNPDQKLTVKGKIHAEEVIVDLNVPVADFVFHPTYKLMPLNQVEQYVKVNNHLPEIPSASEVAKNGMSMGEMQNKLLQKVEELTLYAIEQDKKIVEQETDKKTLERKYNALLEKVEMLTKQIEKK